MLPLITLAVSVLPAETYPHTASAIDNLPVGLTAYLCDAATGATTTLAVGT